MTKSKSNIGFFEKYLTVWVIICMAAGIIISQTAPNLTAFLSSLEYANSTRPNFNS